MIFEVVGWVGTTLILLAYALISSGRIRPNSKQYQALNILGAIGVIANSLVHSALPSVGLNIIWLLIAIYGLTKTFRN